MIIYIYMIVFLIFIMIFIPSGVVFPVLFVGFGVGVLHKCSHSVSKDWRHSMATCCQDIREETSTEPHLT